MQVRTAEQITADNAAFVALSPAQQRVELAKDVIKQLNTQRLVAKAGNYFTSETIADARELETNPELQTLFNEMPQCEVCAKGAMFVCLVDKKNSLKLLDAVSLWGDKGELSGTEITNYLEDLFDRDQLELIESAFEQGEMADGYADDEDIENAVDFGLEYDEDSHRLRAIMENIIANNGEFVV